jgi:hypothetical protein
MGISIMADDYIYTGEVFVGQGTQRFMVSDSAKRRLLEQLSTLP